MVAADQEEEIVRERLRRELTAYVTVPQYNQYFREIGYENEAAVAFDAWNSGDRKRALQSIPDSMVDALYVHGTPERWAARLRDYEKAGITTSTLQIQSFAKSPEERRKRVIVRDRGNRRRLEALTLIFQFGFRFSTTNAVPWIGS